MYYIGLDIGTSSLKTTLMDDERKILWEESITYTVDEPQEGYREIDPEIWYQAVLKGLTNIFQAYDTKQISVIAITGQMHTTVFLDEQGKSARNAIMWNDLRSTSMVEPLRSEVSGIKETRHIAKILSTGCPAMNVLWLKEMEPHNYQRVRKIMTPYAYIVYRLTGKYSLDYCDASTSSMYDIVDKKWSQTMLKKLAIDESYFGELHASCDVIGTLLPTICKTFHMENPIRVIVGTGDNPANAVAMGLLESRHPVISLGTSGVVITIKEDLDFEGLGKNVLFKAVEGPFVNVVQGTVRSAGGTHKWWVENIVKSEDMSIDQKEISYEKLGHNSILFFPHITGDKLIYHDISTRGAFLGLSANSKRADMLQAVFEGVSFALREVLENMNLATWPKRIQINGGGTNSSLWMHILANVLHCEVEVVTMHATPAYGACILASMVEDVSKQEPTAHSQGALYSPQKDCANAYEEKFVKYRRMYLALKEIMQ